MKIERVVVTGGRHFHDVQRVLADLRAAGLMSVAQGGASGADACARNSCDVLKIQCQTYPALWETDGRGAGPRRNIRMLEAERPDLVLAYPDPNSRGTWHCVREALRRGVSVLLWAPSVEPSKIMTEVAGTKSLMSCPHASIADHAHRFIIPHSGDQPAAMDRMEALRDAIFSSFFGFDTRGG